MQHPEKPILLPPPDRLKRLYLLLRVAKHPLRLSLLNLILENGEMNVTDLVLRVQQKQAVVSQHLALLRKANLVNTNRKGKTVFYSINLKQAEKINLLLEQINS